jgi:hypothetical protein
VFPIAGGNELFTWCSTYTRFKLRSDWTTIDLDMDVLTFYFRLFLTNPDFHLTNIFKVAFWVINLVARLSASLSTNRYLRWCSVPADDEFEGAPVSQLNLVRPAQCCVVHEVIICGFEKAEEDNDE